MDSADEVSNDSRACPSGSEYSAGSESSEPDDPGPRKRAREGPAGGGLSRSTLHRTKQKLRSRWQRQHAAAEQAWDDTHSAAEADGEAAFDNLTVGQKQALGSWWEVQKAAWRSASAAPPGRGGNAPTSAAGLDTEIVNAVSDFLARIHRPHRVSDLFRVARIWVVAALMAPGVALASLQRRFHGGGTTYLGAKLLQRSRRVRDAVLTGTSMQHLIAVRRRNDAFTIVEAAAATAAWRESSTQSPNKADQVLVPKRHLLLGVEYQESGPCPLGKRGVPRCGAG